MKQKKPEKVLTNTKSCWYDSKCQRKRKNF